MNLFTDKEPEFDTPTKSALPISSLFNLDKFTFRNSNTLFPVDARIAVTQCRCPFCGNKLYLMRNRKMYYCKSVKHKNKFVISAVKVYEHKI